MSTHQEVLDAVVASFEGKEINISTVVPLCISGMQLVERIAKLKGNEKKSLVLKALEMALEKQGGDLALLATIPFFIDSVIDVEKGVITIRPEDVAVCCGNLCSLFSGKKVKK